MRSGEPMVRPQKFVGMVIHVPEKKGQNTVATNGHGRTIIHPSPPCGRGCRGIEKNWEGRWWNIGKFPFLADFIWCFLYVSPPLRFCQKNASLKSNPWRVMLDFWAWNYWNYQIERWKNFTFLRSIDLLGEWWTHHLDPLFLWLFCSAHHGGGFPSKSVNQRVEKKSSYQETGGGPASFGMVGDIWRLLWFEMKDRPFKKGTLWSQEEIFFAFSKPKKYSEAKLRKSTPKSCLVAGIHCLVFHIFLLTLATENRNSLWYSPFFQRHPSHVSY